MRDPPPAAPLIRPFAEIVSQQRPAVPAQPVRPAQRQPNLVPLTRAPVAPPAAGAPDYTLPPPLRGADPPAPARPASAAPGPADSGDGWRLGRPRVCPVGIVSPTAPAVRINEVPIGLGRGGRLPGWRAADSVHDFAGRSTGLLFHQQELDALVRFHTQAIQFLTNRRFRLDELSRSAKDILAEKFRTPNLPPDDPPPPGPV